MVAYSQSLQGVTELQYKIIKEGRFISRPNRFIAKVNIDGVEVRFR